jgi:hypothetical protein
MGKSNAYRAIFWGGSVAGTLDIAAAFVNSGLRGVSPERVLRSIASGWLGTAAAQGGAAAAALGLLSHFLIATTATAVYYFASRKLKFLIQQPALYGPVYAVAVYLFMNFIVLPLSAFPYKINHTFSAVATGVLILIFCIGLPIAYIVRAYAK